jgi:hypothetical protein
MIREESGEITLKGGLKGDMAGIVVSQWRGGHNLLCQIAKFTVHYPGILAAFNYLETQSGRTDIR